MVWVHDAVCISASVIVPVGVMPLIVAHRYVLGSSDLDYPPRPRLDGTCRFWDSAEATKKP